MEITRRAWSAMFTTDAEGRTISGIAVPYNSPTMIAERGLVFDETMAPGVFDDSIAKRGDRMVILNGHDARALAVGRPTKFRSEPAGLNMDAAISLTSVGQDIVTLTRDGVPLGLSVGFSVPDGGDTWNNDMTQRTVHRAQLHEVSIVNFPAYDMARVEAIRSVEHEIEEREAERPEQVDVVRHQLELMRWELVTN